MQTIENVQEKVSSPLMRVGSTITSSINSPGHDFTGMAGNSGRKNDIMRNSVQVNSGN